ncbi:MAG: GHKL domain-containing protein [Candidatus Latescibacteria bacterium]|nr:GHKL domain-containing protein [Candidatus Latescibacterota bacterium]
MKMSKINYNTHVFSNLTYSVGAIYLRYLLLLFSIILLSLNGCERSYSGRQQPLAVKGELDLRGWDFRRDGPVKLDGEWEFYWENLLTPTEFEGDTPPELSGWFFVPGQWQKYVVNGKKLSNNGYATYRLTILLDHQHSRMAFEISESDKAFILFVNGRQISSRGSVGTTAESSVPEAWGIPAFFSTDEERIEIVFQMSNYHDKKGGITNSIRFGTDRELFRFRERTRFKGTFIFGTLFIMGLYHLGLYLFRREDKSPLFFNSVCFLLALYTILQGDGFQFFNPRWTVITDIDWELKNKISSFALYWTVLFFSMFIHNLYPREFLKHTMKIIQLITVVFSLTVIFASTGLLIVMNQIFQLIIIAAGVYILYVLLAAYFRKREGAMVFLIGYILLLSAGINDVLNTDSTIQLVPAALIIFIITQALFMSYRFSNAFHTVEAQSNDLRREISDRIKAEEKSKMQQEQLLQADKMASLGILISGVAHEINNPNNFIMLNSEMLSKAWGDLAPVLQEYYEIHGEYDIAGIPYDDARDRIRHLISGITEGANRIEKIIQGLRTFSRRDTGEEKTPVDINAIIDAALLIMSNLIKKSTDRFDVTYGENLPLVKGNFQRLEQVVINLITNACQALPDKNKGLFIKTYYDQNTHQVLIEIRDEGVGISPDQLKHIMDPFFTTKRDSGGTGLGLSLSYSIVEEHNGELNIESEPGIGTTVIVSLPVSG